jgi:hypothetical protein
MRAEWTVGVVFGGEVGGGSGLLCFCLQGLGFGVASGWKREWFLPLWVMAEGVLVWDD